MDSTQTAWLARLAGAQAAQQALDRRESAKRALLAKLASDRERSAGVIQAGSDLTMVDKKGKQQQTLDLASRDQTEEFDLDEQRDGFAIADAFGKVEEWDPETGTQAQFEKHLETARRVSMAVYEMESAMTDELDADGKPVMEDGPNGTRQARRTRLFQDEDIATELYDPMRRIGLIAETSIPDKFSRTKEMLDGSFAAYGDRLKKDKKGLGKRLYDENIGLVTKTVASSLAVVTGHLQLDQMARSSGDDLKTGFNPRDNIESIKRSLGEIPKEDGTFATRADIDLARLGFAGQAMTFATDVLMEAEKDVGSALASAPPEAAERIAAAGKLTTMLVGAASAALSGPFAASGMALDVGATFGTEVKPAVIVRLLQAVAFEAPAVAAISAELGRACRDTLLKLNPGAVASLPDPTALFRSAGDAIVSALAGQPDAAAVVAAFAGGELAQAVELYAAALKSACDSAVTPALKAALDTDAMRGQVMVKAADAMTAAFTAPAQAETVPDDTARDHDRLIGGHLPKWEKTPGGWVCTVCQSLANSTGYVDPQIFAGIIEAKIARLERDQALMKWGSTLVGLGIDTAANFIAPLAIAGCAVKVARNLVEAGTRTRDMVRFIEDREGMFNAASAFSAPVTKFIHNAVMQQAHFYANAAFEAAKMIGAILQVSGAVVAPAGVLTTAAASMAQACEAVLYELAKRIDMEVGWQTYRQALARRENRKLGLIALKRNATIAKYSVAWGAVVRKDPLVADFMDACGLTADSLKDPGAKIDLVVKYLETRMPEDVVVTGRSAEGPVAAWAPASVALTPASWIAVKARGESRGGIKPQDTRSFELALKRYADALPAWERAATATPPTLDQAAYDAMHSALNRLHLTLDAVSTERLGGGHSPEMENVKESFKQLISAAQKTARGWAPRPATP